jgi:hypothetical protein
MKPHVVVFDLDETLGFFSSLGVFCSCLNNVLDDKQFYQNNFDEIIDLYPEFLRPGILNILKYLKTKKRIKNCAKVIIYTNNQGPKSWTVQIKDYLDKKINHKLFDQIIAAFKVNGRHVEIGRTSHEKNMGDFINITNLPSNTQVFFLDDQYHMGMEDKNVYYINLFPYVHYLEWTVMLDRFWDAFHDKLDPSFTKEFFNSQMLSCINYYNVSVIRKNQDEYEAEKVVSMKIIKHLKEFFSDGSKYTLRRKEEPKRKTRRKNV